MSNEVLTPAQVEVAQAFFGLPESKGFVVSGGAALLALGLSQRPTQDLDVFTAPPTTDVISVMRAFEHLAAGRGWQFQAMSTESTFCRFVVTVGSEKVLVDLAVDSAPLDTPTITVLGPTMAARELAARKLLALFDRAAARDFVDVYELSRTFDRNLIFRKAAEIDLGLNIDVLAQMMRLHRRFDDDDFAGSTVAIPILRKFFDTWATELADRTH